MSLYSAHLRRALELRSPVDRALDPGLAPKTRRAVKSALLAWAKFKQDDRLLRVLDDLHLPPADRVEPREPLSIEDWQAVQLAVDEDARLSAPTRAVIGLIVTRGFRVGDVLRIQRGAAEAALKASYLRFVAKRGKRLEWRAKPLRGYLKELIDFDAEWKQVAEIVSPGAEPGRQFKQAVTNIERSIRSLGKRAGVEVELYPHLLRRTYAVHFLAEMQGDPEGLLKLKEHMGWSDLNTAMQYLDHSRREAIEEVEDRLQERLQTRTSTTRIEHPDEGDYDE